MLCDALSWLAFGIPKSGHTAQEYEDAFAGDPRTRRFAVADGASESSFANIWAKALVDGYVGNPGTWTAWMEVARASWQTQCAGLALPWYAEAKFEEGAHATLLGVAFDGDTFEAHAVGDCCLFQVRAKKLLRRFPLTSAKQFTNQPVLLCSRPSSAKVKRVRYRGNWRKKDSFFLMTDALAHWFLQEFERGNEPWHKLHDVNTQQQFESLLRRLRDDKQIRNDDATLVRIHSD